MRTISKRDSAARNSPSPVQDTALFGKDKYSREIKADHFLLLALLHFFCIVEICFVNFESRNPPRRREDAAPSEMPQLTSPYLIRVPVARDTQPLTACLRDMFELVKGRGCQMPPALLDCACVESDENGPPGLISAEYCIWGVVVGPIGLIKYNHIPVGFGSADERRATMRELLKTGKVQEDSAIILGGLHELRNPQLDSRALQSIREGQQGSSWQLYPVFLEEMASLGIPLSRLTLCTHTPYVDQYGNLHPRRTAVSIIPWQRCCKVFFEGDDASA